MAEYNDPRHHQTIAGENDQSAEERKRRKGIEFLGFEIRRKDPDGDKDKPLSFVPPVEENEGAYITSAAGGYYGHVLDVRGDNFSNDRDLITKYRNAAMQPECDAAIESIVREAIVSNTSGKTVGLNLDNTELSDKVKEKVMDEFANVLKMLDFRKYGHDIFRRWYVDGRISYHVVTDLDDVRKGKDGKRKGILELRPINPIKIRRIKEVDHEKDPRTGIQMIKSVEEYFVYSEDGFSGGTGHAVGSGVNNEQGLKLPSDSVLYVTSGISDVTRRTPLSYLHKALRNVNQLRFMEDSLVIYRLARAPERRIFYIDVGNLPKGKAEGYLKGIMNQYRNKMVYDAETGEVRDDKRHMSMLEDFWLPRKEGGRGTEISTLPGGENLGQIDDIVYFQKKLYRSLNVPVNRLDNETGFNIGRTTEISRDELDLQKFVDRLRLRFSELFKQAMRTQLSLKGIMSAEQWDDIKETINIDYARDSFFTELKEAELLRERIETLGTVEPHIGKWFSAEWVRKNVLHQTDEEIDEMKKQIRNETLNNDALPNADRDVDPGELGPGGIPGGGGTFEPAASAPDFGDIDGEEGDAPLSMPTGASTALGPESDELDTAGAPGEEGEGEEGELPLPDDDDETPNI